MKQIELDYRYFKDFKNQDVEYWARFYNLKVIYGMVLIVRDEYRNNDVAIVHFLKKFGLDHKKRQIH